jgi:hypothetical protein
MNQLKEILSSIKSSSWDNQFPIGLKKEDNISGQENPSYTELFDPKRSI